VFNYNISKLPANNSIAKILKIPSRLGKVSRNAGQNIASGVFLKKVLAKLKSFGFLFSFRPKSPWQRDKSMGGAARRPANSGIGAIVPNCSNLFDQKLLTFASCRLH